jgi:hypothetical protein
MAAVLSDLDAVEECLVVPRLTYPDERPHLEISLSVLNPVQRRLLGLVGLQPAAAV